MTAVGVLALALLVAPTTAASAADGTDHDGAPAATQALAEPGGAADPAEEPAPEASEEPAPEVSDAPVPEASDDPVPEESDDPVPEESDDPVPEASAPPVAFQPPIAAETAEPVAPAEPIAASAAPAAVVAAAIAPEALVGFDDAVLADSLAIAWYGETDPGTRVTFLTALAQAPAGSTIHIDNTPGTAFRFTTAAFARSQPVTIDAAQQTQLFFARLNFTGDALTFTPNIVLTPTANSQITVNVTSTSPPTITGLQVANDPVTPRTGGTAVNLNATVGATVAGLTTLGIATGANLATSSGANVTGASITGATNGIITTAANASPGAQVAGAVIEAATLGISLGATTGASIIGTTITGAVNGITLLNSSGATIADTTLTGVTNGVVTTATNAGQGAQVSGVVIEAATLGISLGATTGASISDVEITRLGDPTTNAGILGINVANASAVTIVGATVQGFRSAVLVAAANNAAPLVITGSEFDGFVTGISIGSTVDAVVTDVTVRGRTNAAGAITTIAVEISTNASPTGSATVTGLRAEGVRSGVVVPVANTSAGIRVEDSEVTIAPGTSGFGVNLGGASQPVVQDVTVTGPGTAPTNTGITTARSNGATIDRVVVDALTNGIFSTRVAGFPADRLAGPTITNATITDVVVGVYFGQTDGAVLRDSVITGSGDGVFGHENENVTVERVSYTSTGGSQTVCPSGQNSVVRFYYTNGLAVSEVAGAGASQGLYLDMTTRVVAEHLEFSGMTCWALAYAEGATGVVIRDAFVHDNLGGIANFTMNPTATPPDQRIVSSDILIEDSTFATTPVGIHLPLGAFDVTFRNNSVSGATSHVITAQPAHDVTVEGNRIDFTAPGADPAVPPATPQAAIFVTTTWFNLDTQSASSSGISVVDNVFTGDGPFVGVGSVSTVDLGTPLAPPNPSAERTLRDTVEVSGNAFPTDSTAIVTVANAEQGEDADATNELIDGVVAVDARDANDWGSECGPRETLTGYDGGGAYIHPVAATQVLYPQLCDGEPAIEVSGIPHCTPTGGYFDYRILLTGYIQAPAGPIALIWWSDETYLARDTTIDPADTEALLADGAFGVDDVAVPSDWAPGQEITGTVGIPMYFHDHLDVLPTVEARINPSDAFRFPQPDLASEPCAAPTNGGTVPGGTGVPGGAGVAGSTGVAATGVETGGATWLALAVLGAGTLLLSGHRRTSRRRTRPISRP
ncbi:beta strand repeat-containing protein [Agromyces intestinalis]|uniref:beta strand repeat-containing protein n=1 Tax=Agromyces intestinalis TaxID=2592652 RepID=UPI00143D27BD|nr:NosD domain-containing protein [Agromyces intestinalis]